jgi:membrane protein required for colicin V production
MLPDDPESTILKRLKKPKPEEGEPSSDDPPAPAPGQRSSLDGAPAGDTSYGQSDRSGMQQLIQGKSTTR